MGGSTTARKLAIGTRGSALALRQTALVSDALRQAMPAVEIEVRTIRTEGDVRQNVSLEEFGGQGVFVKDIETLLLRGEIDLAVHSLKDMPATLPEGLALGAVLARGDPRDALVTRAGDSLEGLAEGARVGTDSRRRAVQLLALRPDLKVESIRGNVDTRIAKVDAGEYDAVVLAVAGLERLGLLARATRVFSVDEMLPAVGQAVLAIECRADNPSVLETLAAIDHAETRHAITAERAYLRRLGAGCRLPVAAYCDATAGGLRLRALLATEAGAIYRDEVTGPAGSAEGLGHALAESLLTKAGLGDMPWL